MHHSFNISAICLALMAITYCVPTQCQLPTLPPSLPHTLIKFESEAMPAVRLIAALGKAAGIKLECADDLARDVLFLHVHDRPLFEVMTKLAEADAAEWQPTPTGFIFLRSTATYDRLKKKQLDEDEAGMRKQIQPLLDSGSTVLTRQVAIKTVRERIQVRMQDLNSELPDFDKQWAKREQRLRGLDSINPSLRLLGRILRMTGLRAAAAMKPGERIVYATNPTPMQRALNRTSLEYAEAFVREELVWNAARKMVDEERRAGKPPVNEEGYRIETDQDEWAPNYGTTAIWREPRLRLQNDSPPGAPARVMVSFECRSVGYDTFKLMVLDDRLRTIVELHSDDLIHVELPGGGAPEPAKQSESPHISLGPRLKTLADASAHTKRYDEPGEHNPPERPIAELLINPVQNEPLAAYPGDGLSALAKAQGINVAALLPDSSYRLHGWDKGPFIKTTDLIDDLKRLDRVSVQQGNGWLVAKSTRPLVEQRIRVDRSALATYLRTTASLKRFSLDVFATYLAAVEEDADDSLIGEPTSILTSGQYASAAGNEWLLRLYGCLTTAQREKALSGGQVNYGELNSRQRAIAHRAIYGPHTNYGRGGTKGSDEFGDLADEPTEMAPRGLMPMCGVRTNAFVSQRVYVIDPAKEGRDRIYTVIHPKIPLIGSTGIPLRAPAGGFESLLYEVRNANSLKIEADIRPGNWYSYTYGEYPANATEQPVPLANLPKEIREPVERHMAKLKELSRR